MNGGEMRAVRVEKCGDAEVLTVQEVDPPTPGPGQAVVDVAASGVNFVDVYHRTGHYPSPLPFTPGVEGAGVVSAVGLDAETAAASLLQGITAQYLVRSTYRVRPGDEVLVHAAAGGVGLLLTQLVKYLGGHVIGTVSTPEKAELARAAGADRVVGYDEVPDAVRAFTDDEGVAVVYDGVGATTFEGSLASLRPRGYFVSSGSASGPVPPVDPLGLSRAGSVFFTRPTLAHYTAERAELLERAEEVLSWVAGGTLTIHVTGRYPLEETAQAHRDLEGRRTTGKLLIVPYSVDTITLVAEDNGEVTGVVSAIPMHQNVRGTVYPMAGIASVTSPPLARRRGHVRALLVELLGRMREAGNPISVLYPFRPSFYQRFGYVGLPQRRTVTFAPAGLAELVAAELPGELRWERIKDGYEDYYGLTQRLLRERHGFATFPDARAVRLRDADERWLVTARAGGEVIGAAAYRIEHHGGELTADLLLTTGPLSRTLLLQFFARHVDQVDRVTLPVPPDELPELWATDIGTVTQSRTAIPSHSAPMARVLSVEALAGTAVGPGRVAIEVVDDPFIAGRYLLDGGTGALRVEPAGTPAATLTAAGLSALVYGVLDPLDVVLRGLGTIPDDAAGQLRTMWTRATPYLTVDF